MDVLDSIVTERLGLRCRQDTHTRGLWAVYRDPLVMRYIGGEPAPSFDVFIDRLAQRSAHERGYGVGLERGARFGL